MNMNKIIAGIMTLCVGGGFMPSAVNTDNAMIMASAEEYTNGTYEQLEYKNYGDHIEISYCDQSATEVEIPSEIDRLPVTSIGEQAFFSCLDLVSVDIPDSVTNIGQWAFSYCSLKSISFPESVISIDGAALAKCIKLTSVTILNPDCEIYDYAGTISNLSYDTDEPYFNGTIYGYTNSTAQAYADKYSYKFVSLGEAPTEELATGDIDGNGNIDATDASFVLAEYSALSTSSTGTFTEAMNKSADVNGDGKIDSVDSSLILGYYAYTSTGGTDTIEKYLETADI